MKVLFVVDHIIAIWVYLNGNKFRRKKFSSPGFISFSNFIAVRWTLSVNLNLPFGNWARRKRKHSRKIVAQYIFPRVFHSVSNDKSWKLKAAGLIELTSVLEKLLCSLLWFLLSDQRRPALVFFSYLFIFAYVEISSFTIEVAKKNIRFGIPTIWHDEKWFLILLSFLFAGVDGWRNECYKSAE